MEAYTLLCPLITNYVCWMFLPVSSVHTMGCQEKNYEDRTSWGERRCMLRNLIDTQLDPESGK